MKVLVVGDVHGNTDFMLRCIKHAAELGVHDIWQVGDFGYWPRIYPEFIERTSFAANQADVVIQFVDGNHEDHDNLSQNRHPYEVAEAVWHMPRGTVETLWGPRVMFLGGAVSVDRKWRTVGHDWFATEVISPEQMERVMATDPVDIVVAHDCPIWVPLTLMPKMWPPEDIRLSEAHRMAITDLAEHLKPKLWLNGHYHQRVTSKVGDMTVEVLDHDYGRRFEDAVLLIETDDWK